MGPQGPHLQIEEGAQHPQRSRQAAAFITAITVIVLPLDFDALESNGVNYRV